MKHLMKIIIFCFVLIITATFFPAYAMNFNAEETYNSIFVIQSDNSLGSGFSVGNNCIITNEHVIENEKNITVLTYGEEKYEAEVYCSSKKLDIAVLYLKTDVVLVPLKCCQDIAVGDDVYAIGAPINMAYTLTKGIISSKNREIGNQKFIQTDAAINSGNSGGPLLNSDGQVVGVNSYKMSDTEGIGLAIPISEVINYLSENNLEVDKNGNVNKSIEAETQFSEEEESSVSRGKTEASEKNPEEDSESSVFKKKDLIFYLAFAVSVALNLIFVIVFIYQKKKNIYEKYDPSERTDFDIDILE